MQTKCSINWSNLVIGRSNLLENSKLYLSPPSYPPPHEYTRPKWNFLFWGFVVWFHLSLLSYISVSSDNLKVHHEYDTLEKPWRKLFLATAICQIPRIDSLKALPLSPAFLQASHSVHFLFAYGSIVYLFQPGEGLKPPLRISPINMLPMFSLLCWLLATTSPAPPLCS